MLQTQKNNFTCYKLFNNPSVVFDFVNRKGFLISSLSSTWRPKFNACEHLLFFTEIIRTKSLLLPNFHFERNKLRFHPDVFVLPWWHSGKESTCQCGRHRRCSPPLGQEDPLEEEMAMHSSILDSHVVLRNNSGRSHIPFIQFPPVVTSCNTIHRIRTLTLILSTYFHHHKNLSCCPSVATPTSLFPETLSLRPGNPNLFSVSVILPFKNVT